VPALRHVVAFVFALSGQALGAQSAPGRYEFTEVHMAIPVRVVLYADADSIARPAARAAFARIAALDNMMSDYRPQSEVRRLESRPGEWQVVSPELFAVVARAIHVARVTDGAFDPTVGPVVAVWREARRSGRLPPPARLDSAKRLVGWRRVGLDSARQAVNLGSGIRLDLGGIAKGYIIQEALDILRSRGVPKALIEAGGDIVVGDAPPGTSGWTIDAPDASPAMAAALAAITNSSIATSGPAAQYVIIDDIRYSHVVDPRTGKALTTGRTARVVARDGATADALATALTVLGAEAGRALVARLFPGVRAEVREAPY
jgi:thiamine biosynthesis lipoprotein